MLLVGTSTIFYNYIANKNKGTIRESNNKIEANHKNNNSENIGKITITTNYSYNTRDDTFVNQSLKYRELTVSKSEMPYFDGYWPTFNKMNDQQLDWYLYFRDQVQKEKFIDASLGYQFIYIYELLNCTYIPDWEKSVKKLIKFYRYYKKDYPKLDNYLPRWIGDMYLQHGDFQNAIRWYNDNNYEIINYIISKYNFEIGLEKMPFEYWDKLYNVRDNVFNTDPENKELINKEFMGLLKYLNKCIQDDMDQTILDYLNKKNKREKKYQLFSSAIYEGEKEFILSPYKEYLWHEKTGNVLEQLCRYTENKLREKQGKRNIKFKEKRVPGRIMEYLENERFKTIIDGKKIEGSIIPLENKEVSNNRKKIELNKEKIEKTLMEQEEVSNELDNIIGLEDKDVKQDKEIVEVEETLDDIFGESEVDEETDNNFIDLTEIELEIIQKFNESTRINKNEFKEYLRSKGYMVNQIINQLNEKGYEHFNDVLIEEVQDYWVGNESYINNLTG